MVDRGGQFLPRNTEGQLVNPQRIAERKKVLVVGTERDGEIGVEAGGPHPKAGGVEAGGPHPKAGGVEAATS